MRRRRCLYLVAVLLAQVLTGAGWTENKNSCELDPIVVTASRYSEQSSNVAKSVTLIDSEDITKSAANNLPELLKDVAGIEVRDFLGNGKTSQVDMRGFGDSAASNNLVLIDGRRTNQIDLSGIDWSQINTESIDRIEIVRGPQSVLYGDNAVGGVINIITKKGGAKEPQIAFGYKTGSYDYSSYSGSISGGSEFLDYYAGFAWSDTDGYRTNNALEADDFTASMTAKPTDNVRLNFKTGYHKDWYGLPSGLTDAQLNELGRGGSANPDDRAKTDDFYIMCSPDINYEADIIGDFNFTADTIVRGRRTASINYYTGGSTETNNHITTFGLTPKLAWDIDLFSIHNRLITGIDYYRYKDEILSGGTLPKDMIVINEDTLGIYSTDCIDITKRLSISGGGRLEWAYYTFDQQAVLTGKNNRHPYEYALDAGINYKYGEHSSIYADYERSFRLPAVDEWYQAMWTWFGILNGGGLNLDLVPQTGNHYEVGIKDNTFKFLRVNADYFITDLKHELYFDPLILANAVYDRTMRHGLETEVHLCPVEDIDAFVKYTYEKAYYVGSHYAGNEIPIVPRHKISTGLNYTLMNCFRINYLVNYVGARRFINDQLNIVPRLKPYVTHDLKFSYYKYGLEMYMGIYNLLDEQYSEYAVTNGTGTNKAYYPSPGRNVILGVNYSF